MHYVIEGRRTLFEGVLQPWRQRIGATALARIDRTLAIYLRDCSEPPADPRQRPGLLYVPGLGTSPNIDSSELAWLRQLLSRVAAAATEIEACLALPPPSEPAGDSSSAGDPEAAIVPAGNASVTRQRERRTDVYRCGSLPVSIRHHAPQLLAALDDTPLLRIPRHGPDATLIALPAGVRTPVHHGCSNSRCSVVVGLPGSARVDILAGGEPCHLLAGDGMLFDASYDIEYVNRSESEARVLVFDVWHPGLGPSEQQALSDLIAAMVDFDTRLQELP
jgi:aspartate beta-hydroxylase